ncbi:MAG: GTPase Era, partial [Chloroflexi bacterium]|nr:GTPase Era [Chloroflexota bacterium]
MTESEGLLFEETLPPDHRSGYVALVGKPNVGKSTLLNAWLGFKLAPVSPKPQTTRARLLGILTRPDAQIIFVDTPGIHVPRTKLGEYMVNAAVRSIPDADVVVFMVDATEPPTRADEEIARVIHADASGAVVLALNKIDRAPHEQYAAIRAAYDALGPWAQAIEVSALEGVACDTLLAMVVERLP